MPRIIYMPREEILCPFDIPACDRFDNEFMLSNRFLEGEISVPGRVEYDLELARDVLVPGSLQEAVLGELVQLGVKSDV
jgi:hypothetical protein